MSKERPDQADAELVLKLYDLRREAVMRQSRNMIGQWWPKTWEEFFAVTQPTHQMNAAWRQTSSYWEMAYSFARHGVVNADFLVENTGEGLFLYAKVLPFIDRYRKEVSPFAFMSAEWITTNSASGKRILETIQARLRKMMETTTR
jgi:hypothetical protein